MLQWMEIGVRGIAGAPVLLLAEGEGEELERENATTPLHQMGEGPVGEKAHPWPLATPGLVEVSSKLNQSNSQITVERNAQLRLLLLVIGLKVLRQFFNQ